MTILAYSTQVPVRTTIAAIDDVLTKYGAHDIAKIGPGRAPTGVAFALETEFGRQNFRLTVNATRVHKKLKAEWASGLTEISKRETTIEHAEMVAWRQLLKWLESHLAVIDGGLFTMDQMLTAFLEVAPGVTTYELLSQHPERLGLPAPR